MPKKPKPHLTPFARRVLEYLDRRGGKSPARGVGWFLWPLLACRPKTPHGGPNRATFSAGNALGKLGHQKLLLHTWPEHRSPEWSISAHGYRVLEQSRQAGEPCAEGLSECVARLLTEGLGLDTAWEAEGHASFLIAVSYVRFSIAKKCVFDAEKALGYLERNFGSSDADARRKLIEELQPLIEEEDRKIKIC